MANTNGLGATANAVTLGSSGNGSATLIITGSGSTLPYSITVASGTGGTLLLGSNNNGGTNTTQTYSGPVLLNGCLSITSLNTGTGALKFSGVISGAGALTKIDAGKLLLTGTNTFTGNTRIGAGTLQLDAASGTTTLALQKSTLDMNAADTGTLNFGSTATTTITNATFAGLTGSRTLALQNINTTPAAVALSIGNNTTDESYSGALTGTGSLIKIGSNTQTLSGTNTYSGTTAINGGILAITGTGSINNSSGITINGGTLLYNSSIGLTQAVSFTGTGGKLLLNGNSSYAGAMTITSGNTLGGSGTYSNTVTINSGATLSPGNSPGQITVGTLQLNSGSTSHMEIGGTVLGTGYDNVTVTDINGLTYGGILEVVSYGSYNLDQNGSYNLFTLNSGTSSGNFSSITVGSTSLTYSAGVWTGINGTATYQFTDATGILTVTILEPATMSLIFGVMTMGLLPRRRQRA